VVAPQNAGRNIGRERTQLKAVCVIVIRVIVDCQSVITSSILSPAISDQPKQRGLHNGKRHGKEKRNQEKTIENQEGKESRESSEKILRLDFQESAKHWLCIMMMNTASATRTIVKQGRLQCI
jgi:hypothetical protein